MITRKGKPYRELRCQNCRSLLAYEYIYAGRLSIKCAKCGVINDIECSSPKKVLLGESTKPTKFDSKEE